MASIARRKTGKWLARIRVDGREYTKTFDRKLDAQRWADGEKAKLAMGTWTDPKTAQTTVADWCDTWLRGVERHRPNTVRTARSRVRRIKAEFGRYRLAAMRPSMVQQWVMKLQAEGLEPSYVHALHRTLAHIMSAAVEDGIIARSPCSRRTSPPAGKQRAYVATTKQVRALHDAFPPRLRIAVLLGALAGLRVGETCGLRPRDVDFEANMIRPTVQYPAAPLKTDISQTAIPVPASLMTELDAHMARWPGERVLGAGPQAVEAAMRRARAKVPGLPEGFRYHDFRHYYASLLIASGADPKIVQARVRHRSIKTTYDVYGHLWPGQDEATRDVLEAAWNDR
jgi:integrase